MNKKINKIKKYFINSNIDSFFVANPVNVSYLMGEKCEDAWMLVTPRWVFYITDSRYELKARRDFKDVTVVILKDSLMETIGELIQKNRILRLGINPRKISYYFYSQLKKQCGRAVKLVHKNNFVESLRSIKDAQEIQKIKEALSFHALAHKYLKKVILPGKTEREIYVKLESFVRAKGFEFSFSPIIASGPNSCFPHAKITDRKIGKNDIVLVDMGIDKDGYKSDLTRMFFLGKIPKLIREMNDFIKESQLYAIESLRPGVTGARVDQQARKYLSNRNLEKFFSHALGHSIGLEVHEIPCLSKKDSTVLQEGMIVTVEPAVYIPEKFGIRIEDMVLITANGREVLSDNIH